MSAKKDNKRLGFDPFQKSAFDNLLDGDDVATPVTNRDNSGIDVATETAETINVQEVTPTTVVNTPPVTTVVDAVPETTVPKVTTKVTETAPVKETTVVKKTKAVTVVPLTKKSARIVTPAHQEALEEEPVFTPTVGMKEGWERHTYSIQTYFVELIEAEAYWRRKDQKSILNEALEAYFADKKVKPLPAEERKERKPRKKK